MSKAMDALEVLQGYGDVAGQGMASVLGITQALALLRDYITTTEARLNATPASSGKTKAEERDDISIHMQMLCTDDMRADACADAKAHDLPFQVFRILGGYSEALDRLTKSAARIKELEEALRHIGELTEEHAGGPWTKDIHAAAQAALDGARKVEP